MYTLQFRLPRDSKAVHSFIAKCGVGFAVDFANNDYTKITVYLKNVRDLKHLVDILESEEFMQYE